MRDAEELARWSSGHWEHGVPTRIKSVTNDTRRLRRGDLYVALRGEQFDGHTFVKSAFAQGAVAAMVETAWQPAACHGPLLRVRDTRIALQTMATGYRRKVNPTIIGITGSAGKTTVKELTAHVLSTRKRTSQTRGNWNNDVGLPLSLLQMKDDTDIGVYEIGTNHPGEIAALCRILEPSWGIVTNVGDAHIGFFGSEEAIAEEKADLLRSLPDDGIAVLNRDGGHFSRLADACRCRVVTVSLNGPADYGGARADHAMGDLSITETHSGEVHTVTSRLPGMHNAANILLAVAVARQCEIPWESIGEAVATYSGLPMRWETTDVDEILFVNDAHNANPLSMRAALDTFARMECAGRRWLVLGGMHELGAVQTQAHQELGHLVAAGAWAGLITVASLGALIADGARRAGMPAGRVTTCTDCQAAAEAIADRVEPGDAVLLKASRAEGLEAVLTHFQTMTQG